MAFSCTFPGPLFGTFLALCSAFFRYFFLAFFRPFPGPFGILLPFFWSFSSFPSFFFWPSLALFPGPSPPLSCPFPRTYQAVLGAAQHQLVVQVSTAEVLGDGQPAQAVTRVVEIPGPGVGGHRGAQGGVGGGSGTPPHTPRQPLCQLGLTCRACRAARRPGTGSTGGCIPAAPPGRTSSATCSAPRRLEGGDRTTEMLGVGDREGGKKKKKQTRPAGSFHTLSRCWAGRWAKPAAKMCGEGQMAL